MFHLIAFTMDMEGQGDAVRIAEAIRSEKDGWFSDSSGMLRFTHQHIALSKTEPNALPEDPFANWRLHIDDEGNMDDGAAIMAELRTWVLKYMVANAPSDDAHCRVVGIAPSACPAALALFQMMKWLRDEIERIQPLTIDLFLLQRQSMSQDRYTDQVIRRMSQVNGMEWFRHIYVMPWDPPQVEQSMVSIVVACRVSLLAEAAPKINHAMRFETLSSRQLSSPAKYIRSFLLGQLAKSLVKMMVEDGNRAAEVGLSSASGLDQDEHVLAIRNILRRCSEQFRLKPQIEMHAIMPIKDPDVRMRDAQPEMTQLYDDLGIQALNSIVAVDPDAIQARFREQQGALAECYARLRVSYGARHSLRLNDLDSDSIALLVDRHLPKPDKRQDEVSWSGNLMALSEIATAKLRHQMLMELYMPARKLNAKLRKDAMTETVGRARLESAAFLREIKSELLVRLGRLMRVDERRESHFADGLEEAYGYWWIKNQQPAMSFGGFYQLLDECIDMNSAVNTANEMFNKISALLEDRLDELMRPIQARIVSFFDEISLRASLLSEAGVPKDLFEDLSKSLSEQISPGILLLKRAGADDLKLVRSLYIVPDGDAVNEFEQLAKHTKGTFVLRDMNERGVLMLVEYEGNVLDRLAFAELK